MASVSAAQFFGGQPPKAVIPSINPLQPATPGATSPSQFATPGVHPTGGPSLVGDTLQKAATGFQQGVGYGAEAAQEGANLQAQGNVGRGVARAGLGSAAGAVQAGFAPLSAAAEAVIPGEGRMARVARSGLIGAGIGAAAGSPAAGIGAIPGAIGGAVTGAGLDVAYQVFEELEKAALQNPEVKQYMDANPDILKNINDVATLLPFLLGHKAKQKAEGSGTDSGMLPPGPPDGGGGGSGAGMRGINLGTFGGKKVFVTPETPGKMFDAVKNKAVDMLPTAESLGEKGYTQQKAAYEELFKATAPAARQLEQSEIRRDQNTAEFLAAKGKPLVDTFTVEGGRLQTQEARAKLQTDMAPFLEVRRSLLENKPDLITFDTLEAWAKRNIAKNKDAQSTGNVPKVTREIAGEIADLRATYGDTVPLTILQDIKTGQTKESGVFDTTKPKPRSDANYQVGNAAREIIEQRTANDAPIAELNKVIGDHLDAIRILERPFTVKGGRLSKYFGGIIGAGAGRTLGVPILGDVVGMTVGAKVAEAISNSRISNPIRNMMLKYYEVRDPEVFQGAKDALAKMEQERAERAQLTEGPGGTETRMTRNGPVTSPTEGPTTPLGPRIPKQPGAQVFDKNIPGIAPMGTETGARLLPAPTTIYSEPTIEGQRYTPSLTDTTNTPGGIRSKVRPRSESSTIAKKPASKFVSGQIRELRATEKQSLANVQSVLNGEKAADTIADVPGFLSADGKVRELIFGDVAMRKVQANGKHGSMIPENMVINANDWDAALKNIRSFDENGVLGERNQDKINLIKRVPGGNFLIIGADRQNGFYMLTHYEVTEAGSNKLKSLLGRGDLVASDGTPLGPKDFLSAPPTQGSSEGVSGRGDSSSVPLVKKKSSPKKVVPFYKGEKQITTKTLDKLQGRALVSKTFIENLTNQPDMKQAERDLLRAALKDEGPVIKVADFAKKVGKELLPLKHVDPNTANGVTGNSTRYESIALPVNLRGDVANYSEHIYQSPVKTTAGSVHFGAAKNYFAHTRIEDMADGETRRVIEAQSDLFQKGRLDKDLGVAGKYENTPTAQKIKSEREAMYAKLKPYENTWHERIIREEVRQAAKDGKSKLQFPTGETALNIEGLVNRADKWVTLDNELVDGTNISEGDLITYQTHDGTPNEDRRWLVTKNNGNGTFEAVDSMTAENDSGFYKLLDKKGLLDDGRVPSLGELQPHLDKELNTYLAKLAEQLSAKDTVDKENPIYKFYEKEVGRYLQKNYGAQRMTDPQGVQWWEMNVKKSQGDTPVTAF